MRRGRLHRAGGRAWSSRDVRQPDRILADGIGSDKSERWPGTGEIRLAATKHKRAEVETILVDETEVGEAPREFGPGDINSPSTSAFSRRTNASTSPATSVALAATDLSERETTHFGFARHKAAKSWSAGSHSG